MYRLSFTIVVLLAFLLRAHAQTCSQKAPPADVQKMHALVGDWRGEFTDNVKMYSLSVQFYETNQELKVKITNDALMTGPVGSRDVLADASLCSTNKFHFFGQRIDGQSFRYNARLVNGELVGDYAIGESCSKENRSSFRLKKIN
jgi:hypothetical protein